MLARRTLMRTGFARRDALRLLGASSLLILGLTAVLSIDILPAGASVGAGDIAPADITAPREATVELTADTSRAREAARAAVPPQYDYTLDEGQASASRQVSEYERQMAPVDAAFEAFLSDAARDQALAAALPELTGASREVLQGLSRSEWMQLRAEMGRVLETAQRQEIRDTLLPGIRDTLAERFRLPFGEEERQLGAEIISPLLVANSTYDAALTEQRRVEAESAVAPVTETIRRGELLIQRGEQLSETDIERLAHFGLLDPRPDLARLGGWALLSALLVVLLLGWMWRFRPDFWHRNNALLLVGVLLVAATAVLKITGESSILPFIVPAAAVGLLVAVLLDSSAAIVLMGVLGVLAAAISGSYELGTYVWVGGFAGVIGVRKGERVGNFLQAGLLMAVMNIAVVTCFTLLGERDLTGILQLWGASVAAAGGAAVAAVGSFALLGSLFGITTSFQLLELANPSQPLLRRLLMETAGTYHHSLMVGNLAERAAEVIGADPLVARVAAYYHDIGKLANPLAFIENQAGSENPHDELTPEQSATVLKQHVVDGIDLAYRYRLPKAIIPYIPQHHGTALMSYFYGRAKDRAIEQAGALPGSPQAEAAAATVDPGRYRHAGPKPQSREAAILMLADSVEASVRSLTSHEEAAIRAMVVRIIHERLEDGQFDECDLTLRDIERIREAFVSQLLGMYHQRVAYPQNKIVELESRRAASGGGSVGGGVGGVGGVGGGLSA